MTAFTDDDLKRLKKTMKIKESGLNARWTEDEVIDALIVRLEAAEACVIPSTDYCVVCHCEDCETNRKAWRASKGSE